MEENKKFLTIRNIITIMFLLYDVGRCLTDDDQTCFIPIFIFLSTRRRVSIWRLDKCTENRTCFHNQPTRKSSIIFCFYSTTLRPFPRIFSTRKHRTLAVRRIFFVDGEYGFTTLKYFTIVLTHTSNIFILVFSCFFFFKIHVCSSI